MEYKLVMENWKSFLREDLVRIESGDSLWKLSKKYKIPLSAIIKANPQIPDPAIIKPGQLVKMPAGKYTEMSSMTLRDYASQKGTKALTRRIQDLLDSLSYPYEIHIEESFGESEAYITSHLHDLGPNKTLATAESIVEDNLENKTHYLANHKITFYSRIWEYKFAKIHKIIEGSLMELQEFQYTDILGILIMIQILDQSMQ